jgi:class 3 adenylate cyclase/predicted ATPase
LSGEPRHGELRHATVFFADILGYTELSERAGPEIAYQIVTGCLSLLDGIARRHGGVVDKYLGDSLMVLFGVIPTSRSSEQAAAEAALEMQQAVARYARDAEIPVQFSLQVGINTGAMLVGDVRGPVVREFAVMGDAVNVAARLKDLASPGEVLVGEETRKGLQDSIACRPLPSLEVKGRQAQVQAYLVSASPFATQQRTLADEYLVRCDLVGRKAELATLRERVASAASGDGGVVLLVGEAGVGKTRVLAELVKSTTGDTPGATVFLDARARQATQDQPLSFLAELLRRSAGIPLELDAEAAAAALAAVGEERLGAAATAYAPAFAAVLRAAARREPIDPGLSAAVHEALQGALGTIAAERRTVVLCEDMQWIDRDSASLLAPLLTEGPPCSILWLLSRRPTPCLLDPALSHARAGDAGNYLELTLGPLSSEESRALAVQLLAGAARDPELLGVIEARSAGNPGKIVISALLAPALETELRRAREGHARTSEAERRRATILFADITGFTAMSERMEPQKAHAIVTGCLSLLDETARRHGASVDKYLGDCVMAVFGVPLAIEDAPRAAVNAAIEMRRRVQEYNQTRGLAPPLDVHVGIETGPTIAGDVSGPVLREYALMGDSVNIASRLKDIAPRGAIYVGPQTAQGTRLHFDYQPLDPEPIGSRGRTIRPQQLLSDRESLYRSRIGAGETLFSRVAGREAELELLRARLSDLTRGEGGAVAIVGEPGLGKSRLLAELAENATALGLRWLEGRSLAVGHTLSFHPFADLLRTWADLRKGEEATAYERLATEVGAATGGAITDILPFVALLLGLRLPPDEQERMADLAGETLDKLLTRAVRELLAAVAKQRPLVIAFEDLHWADHSSLELLQSLLRLGCESPVIFLLASRPRRQETSGRVFEAARATLGPRFLELELGPLDARATRELLNGLFRREDLPREFRERIEGQASGNPFYIEEVLRSLLEQGAVELGGAGLRATERIATAVIPPTVQEVIMSRVDQLDPQRKLLLQVASVIGRTFDREALEAIVAGSLATVQEFGGALGQLVEAQLLVPRDEAGRVGYGFKHPMIQEVTYDSILHARREQLHREVGAYLEARAGDVPGLHATLAYHFGLGRDIARAENHLFEAGDEAARSAASNEALEFFREAARLYLELNPGGGDPVKRARLAKSLALALFNRGLLPEACERFNEAIELLGEPVPKRRISMFARMAFDLVGLLAELYVPLAMRRRPPAGERERELIDLMFARAKAQVTGDPTRFFFDSMEAIRKVREVDPRTVEGAGGLYAGFSGPFTFSGVSFSIADRLLSRAYALVNRDDLQEWLLFRMMSFVYHFMAGDWKREYEIEDSLLEQGLRHGQLWDVATHRGLESLVRMAQGRFAEAQEHIEQIARIEDLYAYDLASSNRHAAMTFLYTERRELKVALETADTYYREHDEPSLQVFSLGAKAKVQVLQGDLAGARASLVLADEIVRRVGIIPPFNRGTAERSRLLLAVAELEALGGHGRAVPLPLRRSARRAAQRARRVAAKVAWLRPEVERAAGCCAWLLGQSAAALAHWESALVHAERLGARPEGSRVAVEIAALVDVETARALKLKGQGLLAYLEAARRTFDELGLHWDLSRLDSVSKRVA